MTRDAPQTEGPVVINAEAGHVNVLGASLVRYGSRYAASAELVWDPQAKRVDPVPYHLACQALECQLKAFLWLVGVAGAERLRDHFGHRLLAIWNAAKEAGLSGYISLDAKDDALIAEIGELYQKRRFAYFDVDMLTGGFRAIKKHPQAVPRLIELSREIEGSIHKEVLRKAANNG